MAKGQTNEIKEDGSKLSSPTAPVLKADTSVSSAQLIAGTTAAPTVDHNPSEYLLVEIGKDGEEKGTPFNIGVATFNRTFLPLTTGDNPTFLVKKSPIKP